MNEKKVIKMSGFRNGTLLRILKINLSVLGLALIILQIVFMVFLFRFRAFIDYLTSIPVAAFLVLGFILFLLPIAGFLGGLFNNKIILWVFCVINAIITVVLVIVIIICMDIGRRTSEIQIFRNQMFKYIDGDPPWYVNTSKLDAIQMSGCCGVSSPFDWSSRYGGRYPNSCCGFPGPGFDRCRDDQVYKEGCGERLRNFERGLIACLWSYMVITFLLSITSGLIAFFSPRRERSVPPVVYSPPTYSAHLIPVSTPLQIQMRPPLIQTMRRY